MTAKSLGPATLAEAYAAIEGEIAYAKGWEDPTLTDSAGVHSNQEFLSYIRSYTNEALEVGARRPDPYAREFSAHALRKIAQLAIAGMVQNGVLPRSPEDVLKQRHTIEARAK